MKKKKLYLTAFLLVLALALQGGIFSGSGCSNFQKADRICEKKRKLVLLR